MPLLDHFHPPLYPRHHWESFHSNWATRLADGLNDLWLPPEFLAEENTHGGGRLEIDVATYEHPPATRPLVPTNGPPVATLPPATWAPPLAHHARPVPRQLRGPRLLNYRRPYSHRRHRINQSRQQGPSRRTAGLRRQVRQLSASGNSPRPYRHRDQPARQPALRDHASQGRRRGVPSPADAELYAAAYRPVLRQERAEIDLWTAPVAVGGPLPTLPLRLTGDLFVPVDFEVAYVEACRRRRLA